jgi:hypothetical protein
MGELFEARLGVTAAPDHADLLWRQDIPDPLAEVGRMAMHLHGVLEAPQNARRQSRATLAALAAMALRKAE